jgi:hypothetical protein
MRLIEKINRDLARAISTAVVECGDSKEEEGGIILSFIHPEFGTRQFKFIKVINDRRGTLSARGLYVANPEDFGKHVFPLISEGWNMYASFHTHPTFSATPSSLDEDKLFRGFKYNFIFSNSERTVSCSEWSPQNDLHTVYLNIITLLYLANEQT